ncbi:hypothetical protein [Bradyrhizobium elkanii]|uniref:hypothetical protein n=1 Tax=Bradyrhizobium elkanii TaxID=29448 RepID=UPI0035150742
MKTETGKRKIMIGVYMVPDLHQRLKIEAALRRQSVSSLVSNYVEQGIGDNRLPKPSRKEAAQ